MFLSYLLFVALFINTFLSIGVFLHNKTAKKNQLYFIFVTFVDLWIISNFFENEPFRVGEKNIELFLRGDFIFAIFVFLYWLRFCSVFVQHKMLHYHWLNRILMILSIALAVACAFTPFILKNISFYDNIIHFKSGILWPAYALLLLFLSIGGLVILYFGKRRMAVEGKIIQKQQINFIFFGFLLSIGNAIFINLILQTFFPISLEVSRLGLYGMTFLIAFTAYAIVRQRLFELRPVVAKAVAFLFFIAIVAIVYATALFLGMIYLLKSSIDSTTMVISVVLATIVALGFRPLYSIIADWTDKIFFMGAYDSAQLLSQLTVIMAKTIDLEIMIREILEVLVKNMRIEKAAFLIIDNHKIINIKGIGNIDYKFATSKLEEIFHQNYLNGRNFLAFDLLEDDHKMKEIFRQLDISVAIPIVVENDEVAILILGPKSSGEMYYKKDLELLTIFASEAGIAIQNAKAYLAIKKFNEELEQRVMERTSQLKKSQESEVAKAKEVARLKDEFVFIAAHELRAPVMVIRGFLQLMSMPEKKPDDLKERLKTISRISDHLNQLINDLLEVARSEAGTLKIEARPADINYIIKDIVKSLESLAKKKEISIKAELPSEPSMVMADEEKLKEVLVNLIDNAIKYNKNSGSVAVNVYSFEGRIITEVKDTGYGIKKEYQSGIFQKFFRAKSEETSSTIGTGLGLFITRMLVEKMNGAISFNSVEGEGSIFTFSLPKA